MFLKMQTFLLSTVIIMSGFMIKDTENYVGVFTDEGSHLFTTDIYAPDLPEADRESLKDGINVADEIELWSILEDFN